MGVGGRGRGGGEEEKTMSSRVRFSDLQISNFRCFVGEYLRKIMLVRYRGINNKGVLERPGTKWKVLRTISSTLKFQECQKSWNKYYPTIRWDRNLETRGLFRCKICFRSILSRQNGLNCHMEQKKKNWLEILFFGFFPYWTPIGLFFPYWTPIAHWTAAGGRRKWQKRFPRLSTRHK